MTQATIVMWSVAGLVLFSVLALGIGSLIRDITTHGINSKKSIDHIWVEFLPKTGKSWDAIVKLIDQKTGEFNYQGRKYFAGGERVKKDYPPGRSHIAQVTFDKCYADPSSSAMATILTGKPTINSLLVFAMGEQKDTQEAMERSREESSGGASAMKNWKWVYIGLIVIGVISIVGVVFTIKGQMGMEDLLAQLAPTIEKLAQAMGVK